MYHDTTANDEAIARAIAESEGHTATPSPSSSSSSSTAAPHHGSNCLNCPGRHGLELFQSSGYQRVSCNGCKKQILEGKTVWSCVECNFDACEQCYRSGIQTTSTSDGRHDRRALPMPMTNNNLPPPSQLSNPISNTPFSHMCLILCEIGNIAMEMLVDTGAQSSILSMPVVRKLGLSNRLDRRVQGVAAGVGKARILGSLRNVVCSFGVGHVEFLMDFLVLEVEDPLVIIGLDQLRKYKCLVDMERNKVIFGGSGGVEVDMLPASETLTPLSLRDGCDLM